MSLAATLAPGAPFPPSPFPPSPLPASPCPIPPAQARLGGTRERKEASLEHEADWEALLAAANAGDRLAFARFLRLVTPVIRKVIRARGAGLGAEQHEDVLQEVLLAIHLKRQSWRAGTPVRPWLYAIARYKVIDAFRSRGSAIHLPIEDFAESLAGEGGETPLASRDAAHFLAQIDARSAALVRAVALEGESAEVAGARMGLKAGAARVALHRALKRLAELGRRTDE